jgi:hypothetical protein
MSCLAFFSLYLSRFKALKLNEGLSEFKCSKTRGYDFKMVLAILVSMVVRHLIVT